MIRKHNERLLIILAAGVAVLLIAACVLLFSDCGDDDWISPGSSDSSFLDSEQTSELEGIHAAPAFKDGSYTMLSTVSSSEDYTDGNGKVMYSYTSTTKYCYRLDITRSESGLTCRYTFSSIYGAVSDNGSLQVDIDTTDPANRNDNTALYFDLIGQSFTVSVDNAGNITAIDGIDGIIAAKPSVGNLLDEASLLNMASDLFHPMPVSLSKGTSWTVSSYGMNNTYTANRLSAGRFGIDITGGEYTLPDPVTDSYGYTTTYTSVSPMTGTLNINQNDRAVQELTTRQRSEGTLSDEEGYGMYFSITSTNSCVINAAE